VTWAWTVEVPVTSGRLAVIGDTQATSRLEFWRERNRPAQARLFAELLRRRPDALAHLGDMVTWGSSARAWGAFDRGVAPLLAAGVPLLPVLGNHDRLLSARRGEAAAAARFPMLAGAPWYAWRWGALALLALDSGLRALGPARAEAQDRWLAAALAAIAADPAVRALIGYWHHPPMTNSRVVRPSVAARRRLLEPLAACAKTVAVFSGHCHAYEHFLEPSGVHLFVSGGGGGPRQPLHTRPGRRRGEDLYDGGPKRFLHFCELEAAAEGLVVRVIRLGRAGAAEPEDADTVRLAWPRPPDRR
jgi:hypothetical protein